MFNETFIPQQQTITSLQIAAIIGRRHNNVLRDIRKMEQAWQKINGIKFDLINYCDVRGRLQPCYKLTKLESLYVATKFDDESRAKLISRWAVLEAKEQKRVYQTFRKQQERLSYLNDVIESHGTMTSTEVAKELHITVRRLHSMLHKLGVIFKQSGLWFVYAKYDDKHLVDYETQLVSDKSGRRYTSHRMRWTEKGRQFVHQVIGAFIRVQQKPRYIQTLMVFPEFEE